jgi:hypothetical protein
MGGVHSRTLVNNGELEVYVDRLFSGTGATSAPECFGQIPIGGGRRLRMDGISRFLRPGTADPEPKGA